MNNYFTLEEFIFSETALEYDIDNTPTTEVVSHFYELLPLLNEIRHQWGSPVKIISGYMCKDLNTLVGCSQNNDHQLGYAADIQPVNGDFYNFVNMIKFIFKSKTNFNQIIVESDNTTQWVHISVKGTNGIQKHQLFNIDK